jgi:antitoxin component YwqK of YwqJK toxin-antitoxin module
MGIFDWLFGKKETTSKEEVKKPKKKTTSKPKKEVKESKKKTTPKNQEYIKKYHKNGQLKEEGNLTFGRKEGLWKSYYENGQVMTDVNYKKGKIDGNSKSYNSENGQVMSDWNLKDGELCGVSKQYYKNGQLEEEGTFKTTKMRGHNLSQKDGLWKSYFENGQLKKEQTFDMSFLISEKCFNEDGNEIESEDIQTLDSIFGDTNTDNLQESPVKSIDDLDLDPETKKKLKGMTVQVGEDGGLPGIDVTDMVDKYLNEEGYYHNKEERYTNLEKFWKKLTEEEIFDPQDEEMKLMLKDVNIKLLSTTVDVTVDFWKYDSGKIRNIGCKLDSQRYGLYRSFHENGQLWRQENYKDGIRFGTFKLYYENGQLKGEGCYKDGEEIKQKCWDEDGNKIECEE